jgi:HAE1 family hydrophobic/amphiphilic exporter-1
MTIAEFALNKRVTVAMMTFGCLAIGIISFLELPQELFPPITFPQVTIITDYANAAPEEIETLITKPIEEAVGSVAGLKRIESISREGRSTVFVSFNWGQDIDFAALAVREKIDLVKDCFPKESEDSVVLKFDPLSRPIMLISITGDHLQPLQLKLLTEKMLKENLDKVEGVASVNLSGGVTREILIDVDLARLEANHLSLLEMIRSIEEANVSYPAGSIKKGLYEYLIRTMGEFRSVKEIEYAVAGVDTIGRGGPKAAGRKDKTTFVEKGEEGPRDTVDTLRAEVKKQLLQKRLVLVRDVANVTDGLAERTSVSRYNNQDNISLSIQKQANANTIKVVEKVRKLLGELREDLESRGVHYDIIYDHSTFIRASLENLFSESEQGAGLAFLELLVFLRSFASSFVVIITLPITILGCFFLMSLFGNSLNMMSLGGLALAVGMITDASIVVLENIFRKRQEGESPVEAAISGTNEIIWPVITSNLTTMAVFFPLIVFVPGVPGQLFKDLSWAIIYSQIVSTVFPLTLVPVLSTYIKVKQRAFKPIPISDFYYNRLIKARSDGERNFYMYAMMAFIFGLSLVTIFLIVPSLDKEVLPKVDQGQFLIRVNMSIGTRLEVTEKVCKQLEQAISQEKDIKNVAVTIGSEKGKKGQVSVDTLRPSQAIILVSLEEKRARTSAAVVDSLKKNVEALGIKNAEINFLLQESEFQFAEGGNKPVMIEVKGFDFTKMNELVEKVKGGLAAIPGIIEVQDDRAEATPETKLEIDKKRAALYGISAMDISLTSKAAIDGVVATQFREAGKEYDVRVRLSLKDRGNLENLNNVLMYSHVLDTLIPLKEVAKVKKGVGPSEIKRADQERMVAVTADIDKNFTSKDVLIEVQKYLGQLEIPADFQVQLSGKAKEVKENFSKVTFAFVMAVMLNYMIMAAQFESLLQPLIIMFAIPLSWIGVAIALFLSHTSINVISLLGVIILAGNVVNNGIVLLEYANQMRAEGMDVLTAAAQATKIRTRPILMSSCASIIGLAPLVFGAGEGSELRRPLAVTVMGGIISSTFFTLFVIPTIYIMIESFLEKIFARDLEEEAV